MRPYIICHMMSLLDGRIDCDVTEQIETGNEYYDALDQLGCPSTLMGRVTMQMHYALPEPFTPSDNTPIGIETTYVATKAEGYIIAVDTHGSLQWGNNQFDDMPLLVITCEDCPQQYIDQLRKQQISYIATGKETIDLPRSMELLHEVFGVERLSVTGGGHINAAFLQAGLIDEVSMMWCPGIDGRAQMATAFDGLPSNTPPFKLRLTQLTQLDQVIWARYIPQ